MYLKIAILLYLLKTYILSDMVGSLSQI
jgi:hypothetical protein